MDGRWVTLQDAAAELGVSTRTVERRARAGDLESRLSDQGRREVLIQSTPTRADMVADSLSVVKESSERQLAVASTAIQLSQQQGEAHKQELKRSRRIGAAGWSVASVLVIAGAFALWTIARQTGAIELQQARAGDLETRLTDAKADADDAEQLAEAERQRADTLSDQLHLAELAAEAQRARATLTPIPGLWAGDPWGSP